jgi:hypothetical protein
MHKNVIPQVELGAWPDCPKKGDPSRKTASPGSGGGLAVAQAFDPMAAVADVIAVTGDTRKLTHTSAGLLAAVLFGTAVVAAAIVLRGQPLDYGSLGLLMPVIGSWLAAAALVLFSEGPVTSAFAGLRHATGAPVDPSAPWAPLGVRPLADSEVTWDYVVPLIAATRRRHNRARFALSVAIFTAAAFQLWMLLALTAVALTR